MGARYFVIGGNFNLELQPNIPGVTGPQALGRPSSSDYWERHDILVRFLKYHGLCAANTWCSADEPLQTRMPFGKERKEGTQIDYLF
eukprot:9055235-Karenia_brevis.AAC.1